MTKLLQTRSEKKVSDISHEEIEMIKSDITLVVDEVRSLTLSEAKIKLINLRFGGTKNSLLHIAAKFDNVAAVQDIIKMSANDSEIINSGNYNYYTPLHFAAIDGDLEVANLLLKAGADKNPRASEEKRAWTPIHCAVRNNNIRIVELLIIHGVDKETKTSFGLTPLIIAAEFGRIEILDFLLKNGADKNVQTIEDNDMMNALHYAAVEGNFEIVDHLLKAGINRDCETYLGFSALDFAAKIDDVKIANLLLAWGVGHLESALLVAKEKRSNVVKALIEKYISAKENIFNKKWLMMSESDIVRSLKDFNESNLTEEKISLSSGITLNAYGILSLSKKFGFFKKEIKNLRAFCFENNLTGISDQILRIRGLASQKSYQIPLSNISK